jgi:formate hydrogenlyase subunit 4
MDMGPGFAAAAILFIVKALAVTVVLALIEINTVKLRLFSLPNLAALAFILSVLGFMSGFMFGR